MAPTNNHSTHRGGSQSAPRRGRPYRNANTSAGVNGSTSTARDGNRAREARQRRLRSDRAGAPATASTGPSLASRITYSNGRGHGHGRSTVATSRPRPQRGRLQDRITYANQGADGGNARAATNLQIDRHVQEQIASTAMDDDESEMDDIGDFEFFQDASAYTNNTSAFSQASALFCGSQPTQASNLPDPFFSQTEVDEDGEPLLPPSGPVLNASCDSRPIRMINRTPDRPARRPVNHASGDDPVTPKRPVNTYRGKDPIKKIVQNKKLQAILGDKPIPGERKKHRDERVELRMGFSRVLK